MASKKGTSSQQPIPAPDKKPVFTSYKQPIPTSKQQPVPTSKEQPVTRQVKGAYDIKTFSNFYVPISGCWSPPSSPPLSAEQELNIQKAKDAYLEKCEFPFCEDENKFQKLIKIGQGTFGEVFKARDKKNPTRMVAMKKILMDNEKAGFPITALREIRILQQLRHDNVVSLLEICQSKVCVNNSYRSSFYLIFEYCEHDLAGLLSNNSLKFEQGEIKNILQQMLNGLYYIHQNKILHRDIKAANVLITKNGKLKLADFGLARAFSQPRIDKPNTYTNCVVTLWYRPPELLLGECNYGRPIDVWGVGCIMAEMWTRCPIFQGSSEQSQLRIISKYCGSITPEVWPKVTELELFNKLELTKNEKRKLKEALAPSIQDTLALDLLDKLLILDPEKRIDADLALDHDYFWSDPMPCDLSKMMSQLKTCNYEYLNQRNRVKFHQSQIPRRTSVIINNSKASTSGFQDRIF